MKILNNIRQDKALQSRILWDMKPRERIRRAKAEKEDEMKQIQEELEARVGYYFYIDVRYLHAALYL